MADTELRNIRIPDDLWDASGTACRTHGTNRSAVVREALALEVALDEDPLWVATLQTAQERGTTVGVVVRDALKQYRPVRHRMAP